MAYREAGLQSWKRVGLGGDSGILEEGPGLRMLRQGTGQGEGLRGLSQKQRRWNHGSARAGVSQRQLLVSVVVPVQAPFYDRDGMWARPG